jgi:hypothetical protein
MFLKPIPFEELEVGYMIFIWADIALSKEDNNWEVIAEGEVTEKLENGFKLKHTKLNLLGFSVGSIEEYSSKSEVTSAYMTQQRI